MSKQLHPAAIETRSVKNNFSSISKRVSGKDLNNSEENPAAESIPIVNDVKPYRLLYPLYLLLLLKHRVQTRTAVQPDQQHHK